MQNFTGNRASWAETFLKVRKVIIFHIFDILLHFFFSNNLKKSNYFYVLNLDAVVFSLVVHYSLFHKIYIKLATYGVDR